MAIDFTLTPPQRELQLQSRRFAAEVLAGARAAELLPTAEERFLATSPVYEAMVVGGFLRKCISQPAGGENAGLIDMAIMAEEFYSVNASAVGRLLLQRTGRQRQRRFSAARRRRAHHCQTSGRPLGRQWPEKMGLLGDRMGS